MDLAKLRKDLERVHPGGTYTIDARQLKELLTLAEAKVDPWRMFRQQPGTQEQIAHIHERLTALEEAVAPPAEQQQLTGAEFVKEAKEALGGGIAWTDEIEELHTETLSREQLIEQLDAATATAGRWLQEVGVFARLLEKANRDLDLFRALCVGVEQYRAALSAHDSPDDERRQPMWKAFWALCAAGLGPKEQG